MIRPLEFRIRHGVLVCQVRYTSSLYVFTYCQRMMYHYEANATFDPLTCLTCLAVRA